MWKKSGWQFLLLTAVIALCGLPSFAENGAFVPTGRYTVVSASATAAQEDPLSSLITVTIPSEITRVSQAMEYILQRSGWRLAGYTEVDPEVQTLYELPLPTVHRRMGPISLREALQTLAGKPFKVLEDPVHRSIAFTYAVNVEKKSETQKSFWGAQHASK